MREIKFKRVYKDRETGVIKVGYWVFLDDDKRVFASPASVSGLWKVIGDFQYTGLKDKNGKEIYEGDIVRPFYEDKTIAQIMYSKGSFKILSSNGKDGFLSWNYFQEDVEVIGNIFENPELLA